MTHDFIGKLSRGQYLGLQEQKEAPYFKTHLKEETSYKHKPPLHFDPGWWKMLPSQSWSWLISMLYLQNQIDPFSKDFFSSQKSPSLLVASCLTHIPEIWIAVRDLGFINFCLEENCKWHKGSSSYLAGKLLDIGIISGDPTEGSCILSHRVHMEMKNLSFPEMHTWDFTRLIS
jgi:hypothetical protein